MVKKQKKNSKSKKITTKSYDALMKKRPGYFVLTGSQNFLVNKAITESLAGRVGILNLLPFSHNELFENNSASSDRVSDVIFTGGYPRIFSNGILPTEFYPSYILSYIQRDVGQLINPTNICQRSDTLCNYALG